MIIVTGTRRSNPRIRSFIKDLANALPNAIKVNRGKKSIADLVLMARDTGADCVVIVGAGLRGNPGRLVFIRRFGERYDFYPLILSLSGVKLAREVGVKPRPNRGSMAVVGDNELSPRLAEALNLFHAVEPDDIIGVFDRLFLVEGSEGSVFRISVVRGDNLEPYGPIFHVKKMIERRPYNGIEM